MARHVRDPQREAFWRGVVKRFAASGLTVRAYCQREQLTESAFFAWRRTILQRDGQSAKPSKPRPRTPGFLPLHVTDQTAREASITIELTGGRVLRLPESIPVDRLTALIHALEAVSSASPAEAVR